MCVQRSEVSRVTCTRPSVVSSKAFSRPVKSDLSSPTACAQSPPPPHPMSSSHPSQGALCLFTRLLTLEGGRGDFYRSSAAERWQASVQSTWTGGQWGSAHSPQETPWPASKQNLRASHILFKKLNMSMYSHKWSLKCLIDHILIGFERQLH